MVVWTRILMYVDKREMFNEDFVDCTFASRLFERDLLIFTENLRLLFTELAQTFNHRFPRRFLFANFQCLRCGERCRDEGWDVYREDIKRWIEEGRLDILSHVYCFQKDGYCIEYVPKDGPCEECKYASEICPVSLSGRCPFFRKARNKPYYRCKIHDTAPEACAGYLCEKSLPVAHLKWDSVDELIARIGMPAYKTLVKEKEKS